MSRKPTPKKHKDRILVMDTSALITIFSHLSSTHNKTPEGLEMLFSDIQNAEHKLIDRIVIPDHVLYEFTGILPISFKEMKRRFVEHRDTPELLDEDIAFYVRVSPRGGTFHTSDDLKIKSQVEALLRFVANRVSEGKTEEQAGKNFDDVVVRTHVAEHYCKHLKVDHAVLASTGLKPDELKEYHPTFDDAVSALGEKFESRNLRIHIGQLFMMGFQSESQYNERMAKDETALSTKRRFVTINEFADLLSTTPKEPANAEPWISKEKAAELKRFKSGNGTNYLTVGFLQDHLPDLLLNYHKSTGEKNRALVDWFGNTEDTIKRALAPSKLLIEQCVFGGIFPDGSIKDIAKILDYDVESSAGKSTNVINNHLYMQGFFERSLSIGELEMVRDRLSKMPQYQAQESPVPPLQKLNQLIDQISLGTKRQQAQFKRECQNPQDRAEVKTIKATIANIGLPYEKVIAQELINGTLSAEEFLKIVKDSGGLKPEGSYYVSYGPNRSIAVKQAPNPEETQIYVSINGFQSREGLNEVTSNAARKTITFQGQTSDYEAFTLQKLIQDCRDARTTPGSKEPFDHILEAMLYHPVSDQHRGAPSVRDAAQKVLGDERLLQMEKDFSNRRARRWKVDMPPYADTFTALHVNRRIDRKSLGEIATAEAAINVCKQQPGANVWIVNHDSDLFPNKPDDRAVITFSSQVQRMHSELFSPHDSPIHDVPEELQNRVGQLRFLGTDQLMETLLKVNRRSADKLDLKIKDIIRNHKSNDWQNSVASDATNIIQPIR